MTVELLVRVALTIVGLVLMIAAVVDSPALLVAVMGYALFCVANRR